MLAAGLLCLCAVVGLLLAGFVAVVGLGAPDTRRPLPAYRSVVAWYCWRAAELYAGAADSALTT